MQPALFDEASQSVASKSRKVRIAAQRPLDEKGCAATLLPGFGDWLTMKSYEISERDARSAVAERVKQSETEYGNSDQITSESARELWVAVLLRQWKDACCLDMLINNDPDGEEERETQERALRYFVAGGEDFRDVCLMAGFEPEEVRKRFISELTRYGLLRIGTGGAVEIIRDKLGETVHWKDLRIDQDIRG